MRSTMDRRTVAGKTVWQGSAPMSSIVDLTPEERAAHLTIARLKQLVGLRYASDDELVGLVERCLRGELVTADAVKREVRHWRPDYVRA